MAYINTEDFLELFAVASAGQDEQFINTVKMVLEDTPVADVGDIVCCKDCLYCCISTDPKTNISIQKCGYAGFNPIQTSQVSDDFYCSLGIRKDKED